MITFSWRRKKDVGKILDPINHLLPQLNPFSPTTPITLSDLCECLSNSNFHILIVEEKTSEQTAIVGLGTIFFQRNLGRWIAEIHDIVVDAKYRNKGIGEKIVEHLLQKAHLFSQTKNQKIKLYLTSRPERVPANKLYEKLGFVKVAASCGDWGTNLYKKVINPEN